MKVNPVSYQPDSSDAELKQAAEQHLSRHAALQVVVEFLSALRSLDPPEIANQESRLTHPVPELNPETRRELLPTKLRMAALEKRPDLRQIVVSALTGLPKNTVRDYMSLEDQIKLMDQVVEAKDRTARQFDIAFAPEDLALHIDGALILNKHWEKFQWKNDTDARRDLVASFIKSLLDKERGVDGGPEPLQPILTHREVLRAIGTELILDSLPKVLTHQIFDAWLELDEKDVAFRPQHFLDLATPRELVKYISLVELKRVVMLGIEKMGFVQVEDRSALEGAHAEETGEGQLPKG